MQLIKIRIPAEMLEREMNLPSGTKICGLQVISPEKEMYDHLDVKIAIDADIDIKELNLENLKDIGNKIAGAMPASANLKVR